jgi:glycine/D-amino acid oxidase-like deaminating enzyme/nitrite reductase/ring-hydroxylating ferredoxin subunit
MQADSLPSGSYWAASVSMPTFPPLAANVTAEVCVIGGGIGGLTTAYLLAREGVPVVLVEARELGSGETGRTTAHLAIPDDGFAYIERTYGVENAALVAESFAKAIDLVERIVREEQIDCEFERLDGFLISCAPDPAIALERERVAAWHAGVRAESAAEPPFHSFAGRRCLRFEHQAQFHPLKYLAGLTEALQRRGGTIHCGTRVTSIDERDDAVIVSTPTGRITADAVVVATNTPINDRVAIHVKQMAYQTYVVAAQVRKGELPHALLWDDADPYHYVRLASGETPEHELLIVGGEDHKTGQEAHPELHYRALEVWLREHFPMAGELVYRWSGQVMEPLDGIAYLGRNPGSRASYVITGDSGNGMTHATAGAILVSDLILGRENPWMRLYDPARKPLKQSMEFIKEQSNILKQYSDWFTEGDEPTVDSIAPGDGALIRHGLKKIAVYRDEGGGLHLHSATCPHMGCIVQWNSTEKSWDCPCHGSRFSAYGAVLHGPAISALAAADDDDWRAIAPTAAKRSSMRVER